MMKKLWITCNSSVIKFLFLINIGNSLQQFDFQDKTQDLYPEWCSEVPSIPNSVVQRTVYEPRVAQVICNDGYKLVGKKKLTCNNSKWSPAKKPYCEKIKVNHRPHADAGKDIVLYLPTNSVLLNGSNSSDDIGITSYHWWSIGSQVTVDMTGTRTPYLQLYNLEEGVYRFKLKVEDSSGLEDIDIVTVTVKPDKNHCSPPSIRHSKFSWLINGRSGLLQCDYGYFLKYGSISWDRLNIKCLNGKWKSSDGFINLPTCVNIANCGPPPTVPHATVTRSGYNQAVYYCNNEDSPAGILVCEGTAWVGNTPNCEYNFASCKPPPNIENGKYTQISEGIAQFIPGSKVKYTCTDQYNYQLLGNPIIECLKDLTWSRHQPICKKSNEILVAYCPPIPPIPNGKCQCDPNKSFDFCEPSFTSMVVQCDCNSGYRLVGNQVLKCTNRGQWNFDQPTCVKDSTTIDSENHISGPTPVNTLAVVIATACSVLGILLLIMVVMIVRKRKPRPRHYHQVGVPPPYSRVHSSSFDDLDRVALIGYDASRLPSYEEAVRSNPSTSASGQRAQGLSEVPVSSEFRPLPSISNVVRNNNIQNSDITSVHSNRHSITTMSTVNRDGISEVFGSIDTVNYSLSDASTSVTVDTLDSTASRPSNGSGTATAGSVNTSQENIVTEEAPLLENDRNQTDGGSEDLEIKDENKD